MRGDGPRREPPMELSDQEVWRRSRIVDATNDDAERFLDLAGFADELLDPDDRERVAAQLADDPDAAADIAAARALTAAPQRHAAPSEAVIAAAQALVGCSEQQFGKVIAFAPRRRAIPGPYALAQWGSLAAAVVVAGWLGFTLGMDTEGMFMQSGRNGEESVLDDLLDPTTVIMRDLTEGPRT
jgi:anti-sigma factor RsiW